MQNLWSIGDGSGSRLPVQFWRNSVEECELKGIAVAGIHGRFSGEQRRLNTGTKRNHSRANSGHLTSDGMFEAPLICSVLVLSKDDFLQVDEP